MEEGTSARRCCSFAYLCNNWVISALMLLRRAESILHSSTAVHDDMRELITFAIACFRDSIESLSLLNISSAVFLAFST
uniref:Uncharacterized protein n=1 Tax=Arundo donax TaxID=35708 RepID=A0A0A8ZWL7_ARUDO